MVYRLHITGASGTGVSTLGERLADALGAVHLETDTFYWAPTDPPFTTPRPVPERLRLIGQAQAQAEGQGGWVLAGSADPWGDPVLADLALIVFLRLATPIRLARLRRREAARFGDRIRPGGDMHANHRAFLDWAAGYDDPYSGRRSLARHRNWLSGQTAPVLELDGAAAPETSVAAVRAALAGA
ncbi:MAG: adenylate kinase [Rubellimicrobium sp.]|nr:adenylate kinase [Rubellimicrobium sp.]